MAEEDIKQNSYKVLVTGFGANLNAPYGNSTSNPAGLIARSLPPSLPSSHPLNTSGADIEILDSVAGNFDSIPGELGIIRKRIRELHDEHGSKVDLFVHLGRGPWSWVTVERRAFRQDFTCSWATEQEHQGYYLGQDNVKQNVADVGPCPWLTVPIGLNTALNVDVIAETADVMLKQHSSEIKAHTLDVKPHFEAGPAGCGFAFYESMANCFVAGRRLNVLFCHVPRDTDGENLDGAKDAILAVIGAAVKELSRPDDGLGSDWKQTFGLMSD